MEGLMQEIDCNEKIFRDDLNGHIREMVETMKRCIEDMAMERKRRLVTGYMFFLSSDISLANTMFHKGGTLNYVYKGIQQ